MFSLLRKHMKTMLLILLALIVPPFVFWGIGNVGTDEASKTVGMLYGEKVTLAEYVRARSSVIVNLRLIYGPNYPVRISRTELNHRTWDRLLLLAKANQEGITISDVELAQQLQRFFQTDGAYDKSKYQGFLQREELPPLVFERRIRDTLAIGRLSRLITDTALITDSELQEEHLAQGEKIKASYVHLHSADYTNQVSVDGAGLEDYYANHREEFRREEEVRVRYLLVSSADFTEGIRATDAEILAAYDNSPYRWQDPKTQRTRPLEEVRDEVRNELLEQKSSDIAFEKAMDMAMALFDNPDLEAVADKANVPVHATDFFSSTEGSPLNSPDFIQAAFATAVGENSSVIRTPKGFVIVNPLEKKPAQVPELEEVRDLVRQHYRLELAHKKMVEDAQRFRKELAEQQGKGSFEDNAKALSLKVVQVGPFSRQDEIKDVPSPASFKQACFQTSTGELTPLIPGEKGVLFAYVEGRETGSLENFAEEKDTLRLQLLARKKENILSTWYQILREEARLEDRTGSLQT